MKKKILAGVLALSSILIISGCGSKKENDTVKLGIMTTGFTLPLQYAEEKGYFDELGLDVEVEFFSNGPAINEAIASGDIDVAGIGEMPAITGAIANNSKIVAWMTDDEASVQGWARNDSDIVQDGKGNIADYPEIYGTKESWMGKDIVCTKGTSSHYGLLATLTALGLTEEDVNIINMEGTQGAAAFASGTGDIFYGFDPQWGIFYEDPDNFTQVATCENSGKGLFTVLIASESFEAERGEELTKVIQGMLKAKEEFRNDSSLYETSMYDWQNTYGSCSETLAAYSAQIKEIKTLDEQKAIFEGEENATPMHKSLEEVAQFLVDNSAISSDDKEELMNKDVITSKYLFEAVEKVK